MRNLAVALVALSMLLLSGSTLAAPVQGAGAATATAPVASLGHTPTYVGPASKFMLATGPIKVTPTLGLSTAGAAAAGSNVANYPSFNPRPALDRPVAGSAGLGAAGNTATLTVPPVVSCQPMGPGCDAISTYNGGAKTNGAGLNSVDSAGVSGFTVEPPDQGMCAGNGYVMEIVNPNALRVFHSNLATASADISLDSLMGLTQAGYSSGGDVQCLYDQGYGGHWFVIEIVSTNSEASGGTFAGCFAGVLDGCLEGIAVSVTNDPTGAYNVYFLNPNAVNIDPGAGYLLNDYAKIATTQDAFLIFYDEFILNGSLVPACPAYGCFGFNGAQEFAISKKALELGFGVSSGFFNTAYENMGLDPTIQPPDGACAVTGYTCWYQVIPAQSPDPSQYNNAWGGSGFMLGSLDFVGAGDNRIAAFYWTGLSNLATVSCAACGGISFGGQLFTGLEAYMDEGAGCLASLGGPCGLAAQKAGPVPLGANCVAFGLATGVKSCPENGIATNGDGFTEVSYAEGQIWGAVSTLVTQKFGSGTCGHYAKCETHVGAAYWVIGTGAFGKTGMLGLTSQGYVTAAHEDLEFPTIAGADHPWQGAVISFTLSGNGGPTHANNGGFFPSSAFGRLTATSGGLVGATVHITALGKGAQDGFTEYLGYPGGTRPRWGDYGSAIFVPGANGGFYFASEYIPSPNCSPSAFLNDPSCGGTRAPYANFGTSLNVVG